MHLARDRIGIKPLFWGRFGGLFVFGSELKALRAHAGWPVAIDRDALAGYMRFMYVPAPWTIYSGVRKLEPGRILTVDATREPTIETYWDLRAVVRETARRPRPVTAGQALDALEVQLSDAVRRCMISDVPLGAFLSGGIDSSTIVALMQAQSDRPVRTFSAGFHEARFNEAE